jgi:hypothetical protein
MKFHMPVRQSRRLLPARSAHLFGGENGAAGFGEAEGLAGPARPRGKVRTTSTPAALILPEVQHNVKRVSVLATVRLLSRLPEIMEPRACPWKGIRNVLGLC